MKNLLLMFAYAAVVGTVFFFADSGLAAMLGFEGSGAPAQSALLAVIFALLAVAYPGRIAATTIVIVAIIAIAAARYAPHAFLDVKKVLAILFYALPFVLPYLFKIRYFNLHPPREKKA